MGLTNTQRILIREIMYNDKISDNIRSAALLACREDKTEKNKAFCREAIMRLEKIRDMTFLPNRNKNLIVEDVSDFIEARYYLSVREKALFAQIDKIRHVSKKMRDMQIRYLNTVLLYGESGTGKTTFGRYLAYKFSLPFMYVNLANLVDSLMGKTSKNIASLFTDVKDVPCVLMLDEIDSIGSRRGTDNGGAADKENNLFVITLLQELDRINQDMLIIAATNRFDLIDNAIIRRFSVHHEVQRLSLEESRIMLYNYIHDLPMDIDETEADKLIERFKGKDIAQSYIINALVERIAEILAMKTGEAD